MYSEYRSEAFPAAERYESWLELVSRSVTPMRISGGDATDFRATMRLVQLGGEVQISVMRWPACRLYRTPKMVRQTDPELLNLSLTVQGRVTLTTAGRQGMTHPHDLLLYDTTKPFEAIGSAGATGTVEAMLIQVPRATVPLRANGLRNLIATPLPGAKGLGAVLVQYATELLRHTDHYRPPDLARLASTTTDLVTAFCAHHLESTAVPPETHQRVLQLRIHDFIRRHLGDPALSPTMIAAANQVSLRHLHRIFNTQGLTVADWIRTQRLDRARRDLTDPTLAQRPIHAIATRWGFTHAAHFNRLFRRTYDMTPGEYRRTHTSTPPAPRPEPSTTDREIGDNAL